MKHLVEPKVGISPLLKECYLDILLNKRIQMGLFTDNDRLLLAKASIALKISPVREILEFTKSWTEDLLICVVSVGHSLLFQYASLSNLETCFNIPRSLVKNQTITSISRSLIECAAKRNISWIFDKMFEPLLKPEILLDVSDSFGETKSALCIATYKGHLEFLSGAIECLRKN